MAAKATVQCMLPDLPMRSGVANTIRLPLRMAQAQLTMGTVSVATRWWARQ
jgi:hypothetical protein